MDYGLYLSTCHDLSRWYGRGIGGTFDFAVVWRELFVDFSIADWRRRFTFGYVVSHATLARNWTGGDDAKCRVQHVVPRCG